MSSARRRWTFPCRCPTCFVLDSYDELHNQYGLLTKAYPGWNLTEIRGLTIRERVLWILKALER